MAEPFPGTREGRPFGTFALIWGLPAERRREVAWIELGDGARLAARGRQWCGGEARAIDVAWIAVPDLTVHRDHQIYEPLGAGRLRFRSPEADFERIIELSPTGFVHDYPDIARHVATVSRRPPPVSG